MELSPFLQLKSLTVGVEDSARECIRSALRALDLSPTAANLADENDASAANVGSSNLAAGNSNCGYQLWVRTKLDESPYPLIGHEVCSMMPIIYLTCMTHSELIDRQRGFWTYGYVLGGSCDLVNPQANHQA